MKSPFPGMDPYLEQRGVWSQVHTGLIVGIQQFLTPRLRPKYRVAMEQRNYLAVSPPDDSIGDPDIVVSLDEPLGSHSAVATLASPVEPLVGVLPTPRNVKERYLEIRKADTKEVVTVIEILSPANKRAGVGRTQPGLTYCDVQSGYKFAQPNLHMRKSYQREEKRTKILGSWTNFIEIDLLRAGTSMPMTVAKENHYRIVVSRAPKRPSADFYLFSVRQPIPDIPVPLLGDDAEPLLELNRILHRLYDQSGYDMDVNYSETPPPPAFSDEDAQWVMETGGTFNAVQNNGHAEVIP